MSELESKKIWYMRAVAIFCVVCAHMQWPQNELIEMGIGMQFVNRVIVSLGVLGVPTFFFLAGYCFTFGEICEFIKRRKNTIVPWIADWLYYYEVWLFTGEWEGGGIHFDDRKPYRKT